MSVKLKNLITEVTDHVILPSGKELMYNADDAIPFVVFESGYIIYTTDEYPVTHGDIGQIIRNLQQILKSGASLQPVLDGYNAHIFPKLPTNVDDISEGGSIDGRLWLGSKIISFWEDDEYSVTVLKEALPFLKKIGGKEWSQYKLELHRNGGNDSEFIPVTDVIKGELVPATFTNAEKERLQLLKKYHQLAPSMEKNKLRLKLFPQSEEMPKWKELGYNSEAEYNFKRLQNVAESQTLTETPDEPHQDIFPGASYMNDATVTFCATDDWIVYGKTSNGIYHGTIVSLFAAALKLVEAKHSRRWSAKKVGSLKPYIEKVFEDRSVLRDKIHIIGNVDSKFFEKMNPSHDSLFTHDNEYVAARSLGVLNGRLWPIEKIISFWDDDTVIKRKASIISPLLDKYGIKPDELFLDLQSYHTLENPSPSDAVKLSDYMGSGTGTEIPQAVRDMLNKLKSRLHDEPSKQPEVRKDIKRLMSKFVGTQDIDIVVDKILDRMLGSMVGADRAQRAGYNTSAEYNFHKDRYTENIDALRVLCETPDDPLEHLMGKGVYKDLDYDTKDAVTFILYDEFVVYGPTRTSKYNEVYHNDLRIFLEELYDHTTKDTTEEEFNKLFERVFEEFTFYGMDIRVFGKITPAVLHKYSDTDYHDGRRMGVLSGRLWTEYNIISFWTSDEVVKENLEKCRPFVTNLGLNFDSMTLDLFVYYKSENPRVYTVGEVLGRGTSVPDLSLPGEIKKQLNILKAQLHSEPSKAEEVKKAIMKLVSKYSKTKDVDALASKIFGRMMGSEVDMDRAKRAGYDTVAQRNASRPALEETRRLI